MPFHLELTYSDHDIDTIKGIQFCVMSPEEIVKRSVAEINNTETSQSVPNGLFDARMGVTEYNQICPTCLQKNTFCPGHFGYIALAKPVFHIQFYDIVKRLLRCVCHRCSKLLIDPDSDEVKNVLQKKLSRQKRWEILYNMCNNKKRCGQNTLDGCGARVPKSITRENMLNIGLEWRESTKGGEDEAAATGEENVEGEEAKEVTVKHVLTAEDVLRIFRRISDKDAEVLGFSPKFNRPEWMICTMLPVPPPTVRPSVRSDNGARQEDDLTHKLSMIIKYNNNLRTKLEKLGEKVTQEHINIHVMMLQWEVATMIDNTIPGISPSKQRTGRPMRSLTERLKSKEGRIRGNLMGKRVDFSARSVITPDPNLSIDELGVPYKIAMNLTFPEIVNDYNKEFLRNLVRNGPDVYPGAKFIKKKNGATYRLKNNSDQFLDIQNGDIIDRHLHNGDPILFNRQPSLHRMSMMTHKARIMPHHTFRINVCVTPPYNADFDGDEMNAHVPQSLQTAEELSRLSSVSSQVISPRECKPIISIAQDIVTGLYRLTMNHVRINEKQLFNLIAPNPRIGVPIPKPFIKKGKISEWTGHQVLSTIIPDKVNLRMDKRDERLTSEENANALVEVKNGQIISGAFSKDVYQAMSSGIVHQVYNEYGPEETRRLFDNTQILICNWLMMNGFSVGVSDMVLNKETIQKFKDIIHTMKVSAYDQIARLHKGEFENNTIKSNNELFEENINTTLNRAIKEIGAEGRKQIDERTNRLINMIKSKAKGNDINVAQMMGCVGQQNVNGKRIPYGFDDRTLPHFTKYDDGPESRGFVENSFMSGLTPQEFFFAAMGGREGLIDTAVQTSSTGYIQRKLVKAMEDCKVNYDMSIRNANGNIIQFLYGEDGMDSIKIESQKVFSIEKTPLEIEIDFAFSPHYTELKYLLPDSLLEKIKSDTKFHKHMQMHVSNIIDDREFVIMDMFKGIKETQVLYPVHFYRIINIVTQLQNEQGPPMLLDLDPRYILKRLSEILSLRVTKVQPANRLFQVLARIYLNPKRILLHHRLCKASFDAVIDQIKLRFYTSFVHPSEMVGVIAAQSIGEPSTQLTLNTFHSSGISAASKAVRGVPRLNELLSVSKVIKSPIMEVHLQPEINKDKQLCLQVMNDIRTVRFKDIVKSLKIYFDPEDFHTSVPQDQPIIDLFKEFSQDQAEFAQLSPWLLRMEFDKNKMLEFNLDMIKLYQVLDGFYEDKIMCLYSDDNAQELVMRIKLRHDEDVKDLNNSDDMLTELKALEYKILENFVIKGVRNIDRASITEEKKTKYNALTHTFDQVQEWITITDGSNLQDIFAMDVVDETQTISNDVNEIYEVLGVEAARAVLYKEIVEVLDNLYINYRHIALLVDVMTNKGNILSVNRHGINRGDIGPLAKCSFEETTDKLVKAGVFAEYDKINGMAANVMLGQVAPAGTGDINLLLDETMLPTLQEESLPVIHEEHENEDEDDDEEKNTQHAFTCSEDALRLDIDIPHPNASQEPVRRKAQNEFVLV